MALQKLLKKGCKSVLLTLGPEGALYGTKEKAPIHIKSPKVTAIDSTVL